MSTLTPTPAATATARSTATAHATDATLVISFTSGVAGETMAIEVFLQTTAAVGVIEGDIVLGPEIGIATDDSGRPRCSVNPEIEREQSSFRLHVASSGLATLRALIVGFDSDDPIPDGSTLFTCEIAVAADVSAGVYPLTCGNASANDMPGNALLTACVDGAVQVVALQTATPTPTRTPFAPSVTPGTPTPTSTSTPIATPANTARPRSDDDGCQVGIPRGTSGSWVLTLTAVVLWLRRRSRGRR